MEQRKVNPGEGDVRATSADDLLYALQGGKMDYPQLLEALALQGTPARGVMLVLERMQRDRRVRLTNRHGEPWVSAYFKDEDADDGPMYVEATTHAA